MPFKQHCYSFSFHMHTYMNLYINTCKTDMNMFSIAKSCKRKLNTRLCLKDLKPNPPFVSEGKKKKKR